ncbi:unnamed protein product [Colias eurytheme]|nr:unnamed protein product [Colias eurytheme]
MANKCSSCGKFCAAADGAKCNKCSVTYHKQCCNVSPDTRINAKWVCHKCKPKNTAKALDNITTQDQDIDEFQDANPSRSDSPSLTHEIKLLRTELSSFRLEMSKLSALVSSFGTRLDNVEERVSQLEAINTNAVHEHEQIQQHIESIDILKKQLNESEQERLLNDIEITNVPEVNGENLLHVAITLAQKIGLTLDERDIANVHRRGIRRRAEVESPGSASDERVHARPIVVRLTRRHLRDELLHAARVRRGADTANTGVGGAPRRFYVNEHLTYTNRNLFYSAREKLGRSNNWRFVWTRGGRIFARRDNKSKVVYITCEKDIDKVFCS